VKKEPLLEQLKSTVKDIHNAIGEGQRAHRTGGGGSCSNSEACAPQKAFHRPRMGPGEDRLSSGWRPATLDLQSRPCPPFSGANSVFSRQEGTLL